MTASPASPSVYSTLLQNTLNSCVEKLFATASCQTDVACRSITDCGLCTAKSDAPSASSTPPKHAHCETQALLGNTNPNFFLERPSRDKQQRKLGGVVVPETDTSANKITSKKRSSSYSASACKTKRPCVTDDALDEAVNVCRPDPDSNGYLASKKSMPSTLFSRWIYHHKRCSSHVCSIPLQHPRSGLSDVSVLAAIESSTFNRCSSGILLENVGAQEQIQSVVTVTRCASTAVTNESSCSRCALCSGDVSPSEKSLLQRLSPGCLVRGVVVAHYRRLNGVIMRLLALEYVHSKGSAANPDDAHLTKRLCSYKTTSTFLCTEARSSFEDTLNETLRGASVFPTGSPVLHYARKATTPCLYAFLPLWETPLELPSSPYRLPGYSEQNETADLLGTYVRGRIATSTFYDDTLTELGRMFSKLCSDNVADLFDIKHPSKFAALPSMSRFNALGKTLLHALGAASIVTLQPPSQRALRRTLNNLELPIGFLPTHRLFTLGSTFQPTPVVNGWLTHQRRHLLHHPAGQHNFHSPVPRGFLRAIMNDPKFTNPASYQQALERFGLSFDGLTCAGNRLTFSLLPRSIIRLPDSGEPTTRTFSASQHALSCLSPYDILRAQFFSLVDVRETPQAPVPESQIFTLLARQRKAWAHQLLLLGLTLARQGEHQRAILEYDAALLYDPNHVDALVARGAAHANVKSYAAALCDLNAALALDPTNVNALRYRLKTLEQQRLTHRITWVPEDKRPSTRSQPSKPAEFMTNFCLNWSDEKDRLSTYR